MPWRRSAPRSPVLINQASPRKDMSAPASIPAVGLACSNGMARRIVSIGMVARISPMDVAVTLWAAK